MPPPGAMLPHTASAAGPPSATAQQAPSLGDLQHAAQQSAIPRAAAGHQQAAAVQQVTNQQMPARQAVDQPPVSQQPGVAIAHAVPQPPAVKFVAASGQEVSVQIVSLPQGDPSQPAKPGSPETSEQRGAPLLCMILGGMTLVKADMGHWMRCSPMRSTEWPSTSKQCVRSQPACTTAR